MRISGFRIRNYKSFRDSGYISLRTGFNIVVGENNVGKTALLEALSLQHQSRPHRSLATAPHTYSHIDPFSTLIVRFDLNPGEAHELLPFLGNEFYVQDKPGLGLDGLDRGFREDLGEAWSIDCEFRNLELVRVEQVAPHVEPVGVFRKYINDPVRRIITLEKSGPYGGSIPVSNTFSGQLAISLRQRIYAFRAERLNLGEFSVGNNPQLQPNAANLAQVLNYLQSSNPSRFRRLNEYVRIVLPHIQQITVPPLGTIARILVWSVDPETEREDLAVPLSESGTGISQVLAILYVVINSNYPQSILIDEPQSFLHPGAIRKLIEILKEHDQHQYVITTHSPVVISSASPSVLLRLKREELLTTIEELNPNEADDLKLSLLDVGAKLSDVFGADQILWVEGPTEEICIRMIVEDLEQERFWGTEILGVRNTGDLEGRHARTIFEIYSRLSQGRGLLPPAVGFIFDREGRTEQERIDIVRQSRGMVKFTDRRMFENYLLNPVAIASVLSSSDEGNPVSSAEVLNWLHHNGLNARYFPGATIPQSVDDATWKQEVHAAKVLDDLFYQLSSGRVAYHKVKHGEALTRWIIASSATDFDDLRVIIRSALGLLTKGDSSLSRT